MHLRTKIAILWFGIASSLSNAQHPSDALFEERVLRDIRITMAPQDWEAIVQDPRSATVYPADFEWNGESLSRVGIRAKGQSSREPGSKPALRFRFNHFRDQTLRGLTRLDLQAMKSDPSMMRERLVYNAARRAGVIAPRSMHARLFVNGVYKGLYLLLDQFDQAEALRIHFPGFDHRGNLYKLVAHERGDVMVWIGDDPSLYVDQGFVFERGSDSSHGQLLGLLDVINNTSDEDLATQLPESLALENFFDYCALNAIIANEDWLFTDMDWESSPPRRGNPYCHNTYWYAEPSTRRMYTILWDVDGTMSDLWTPERWVQKDLFLEWGGQFVLLSRLAADAARRQEYLDRVLVIANGAFSEGPVLGDIDSISRQIETAVRDDPARPYSFVEHQRDAATLRVEIPLRLTNVRRQAGGAAAPEGGNSSSEGEEEEWPEEDPPLEEEDEEEE